MSVDHLWHCLQPYHKRVRPTKYFHTVLPVLELLLRAVPRCTVKTIFNSPIIQQHAGEGDLKNDADNAEKPSCLVDVFKDIHGVVEKHQRHLQHTDPSGGRWHVQLFERRASAAPAAVVVEFVGLRETNEQVNK